MANNTAAVLTRTTFQTSRSLEFFTEKELTMQIGATREQWPVAILKELIDNSLDACETAGIAPEITVTVEDDAISVQDNGPGLPTETLAHSLDYLVRVSDKAHYVSPSRGQLGNALKCVWAVSFVIDGTHGHVEVTTAGVTHSIDVTLDRIAQEPRLRHTTSTPSVVRNGTFVKICWPEIASYFAEAEPEETGDLYNASTLLRCYAAFNPHAAFTLVEIPHESLLVLAGTTPTWKKWLPSLPTSAHWYTVEKLRALIGAYLTSEQQHGQPRTVRAFIAEFDSLKGTAKQKAVAGTAGLSGATLRDLVQGNEVAVAPVQRLLTAMQRESRVIQPIALGVLGEVHLTGYLDRHCGVTQGSVTYKKLTGIADGVPFVLEVACGWTKEDSKREQIVGLNWSPALKAPFPELLALLGENRVDRFDPVTVIVHLASPRLDFTDRGKSVVALPSEIRVALRTAITTVTKTWKGLKKQSDHNERVHERDRQHWLKAQQRQFLSIKAAAYQIMWEAYRITSADGTLPANARQIMYTARPMILRLTGGQCWKNSAYFTQHLLPDFVEEYPDLTEKWDVVFDSRGHLVEPHTETRVDLGTLAVRRYLATLNDDVPGLRDGITLDHSYPTAGPGNRYRFVLFIEKEGFNELLAQARIAARFDLAIMSTKGMSVTAARQLVEELTQRGVTILVWRDFDKAGFSIVHTLRTDTRRHKFAVTPNVIDLGLRLQDVLDQHLESEPVEYDTHVDPRINLRESGATEDECNFLVRKTPFGWSGDRVELNAMTSPQFLAVLEAKLEAAGVQKVIPAPAVLADAYRRAVVRAEIQRAIDHALRTRAPDEAILVPANLEARVRQTITGTAQSWDEAVQDLAHGLVRVDGLSVEM